MTEKMISIHNAETGEFFTRPMNADELAQLEIDVAVNLQRSQELQAEAEAKEAVRQSGIAKLMALGLTEEEAQALVK